MGTLHIVKTTQALKQVHGVNVPEYLHFASVFDFLAMGEVLLPYRTCKSWLSVRSAG
jgi:hypothetical protein